MSEHSRRDRYDTSANPEDEYVDSAHCVLKNLLGITELVALQEAEEAALANAYAKVFKEIRFDTRLSSKLIQHIHARIFKSLFAWAGRWRTVWISKPGTTWPPPDFLDQSMRTFEKEVLQRYTPTSLKDDELFCQAIGHIQGEFLVIHPFREGNARTIKLLSDILAIQSGRPILSYDNTLAGADAYIEASKRAFRRDYVPLAEIIRRALDRARLAP